MIRIPEVLALAAFSALVGLVQSPAKAHAEVTLFYGGDPSQFNSQIYYAAANYTKIAAGTTYTMQQYDNFSIPVGQSWSIGGFFAQIGNPNDATPLPLATWEIRTGMSDGSKGTLLDSGTSTVSTTTVVHNGFAVNGVQGETLSITLTTPLVLTGGQTYWLSLLPQSETTYNMFIGLTDQHANAVGGPLDDYSLEFDNMPDLQHGTNARDLSLGVLGSASQVPEPPSLALFAGGLWALGLLRRRNKP